MVSYHYVDENIKIIIHTGHWIDSLKRSDLIYQSSILYHLCYLLSVPPKLEKDIKDQQVQKGDQFKIKIPFSGTGPFEFKVKKNNKDLTENDRVKISTFDDYVTIIIKG